MTRKILAAASLLALSTFQAHAATATGTLGVSLTVAATCTISSVANVTFGTLTTLVAGATANGAFTMTCSNGVAYQTTIGTSVNASGVQRRMVGAVNTTSFINYNLFSDAARTIAYPTVGVGIAGSGTGAAQTTTIFGAIPAVAVTPKNDIYSDTVTITVTY